MREWAAKLFLPLSTALSVVAILLLVGLSMRWQQSDQIRVENLIRAESEHAALLLETQMALIQADLTGLKILFESSEFVTREEFRNAASAILHGRALLQSASWIPRVDHSQRQEFESAQSDTHPDFFLTEVGADNQVRKARNRPHYYPTLYIEPEYGHDLYFGLDIYADPSRRAAIDRANENRDIVFARALDIAQSPDKDPRVMLLLPIYQGSRLDPAGLVGGTLKISRWINTALPQGFLERYKLSLGTSLGGTSETLYSNDLHPSPSKGKIHRTLSIAGSEQEWWIDLRPTEKGLEYIGTVFNDIIWLLVLTTIGAILLLWLFLAFRERHTRKTVTHQTQALRAANRQLEEMSLTDSLTKLPNRRSFDRAMRRELLHCKREGTALSVLMIDIDHFKLFNDHYGHPEGDKCLQAVANKLKSVATRPRDLVARYGGEEFVIVLPETGRGCELLAESCRKAVEELQIRQAPGAESPVVTISIGGCFSENCIDADSAHLVLQADSMLYKAKASGRNCVVITPFDRERAR